MTDYEKLALIKKVIVKYRNVPEFDIKDRKREHVQVRQEAHYFAAIFTRLSLAKIGANIGEKNHATVLYSKNKIIDLISVDKYYKKEIELLEKLIKREFLKDPITGSEVRSDAADFIFENVNAQTEVEIAIKKNNINYTYHSEPNKINI